jgi:hypothetical protein
MNYRPRLFYVPFFYNLTMTFGGGIFMLKISLSFSKEDMKYETIP